MNDNVSKSSDDIMNEFILNVQSRLKIMFEYSKTAGIDIPYSETSLRYQEHVKKIVAKKIAEFKKISHEKATNEFDEYIKDLVVSEYLSKESTEESKEFFALKKKTKSEDMTFEEKAKVITNLDMMRNNVFEKIPLVEKRCISNKFIDNTILRRHANTKMKAEIDSSDGGYCLKAITQSLYDTLSKYDLENSLPSNTSENGRVKVFVRTLQENEKTAGKVYETNENMTFRNLIENKNIKPGAIIVLRNNDGNPQHAMFWDGKKDEHGELLLCGFNAEEENALITKYQEGGARQGFIIDTNSLVKESVTRKNSVLKNSPEKAFILKHAQNNR